MVRVSFLLVFTFITSLGFGQGEKKLEKEKRIKEKELPEKVLKTLQPYLKDVRKLKYYEEFDGSSTSFEAKFIYYQNKFSVEFSEDGNLEDVEVIRCFTELPTAVQNKIVDYLYPNENFKIRKTQKQFSGTAADDQLLKDALKNIETHTIRYELIVEVKAEKNWLEYEMLFDSEGNFIKKKQVISRSEDHVLY